MPIFVDSCVLIASELEDEPHHRTCRDFLSHIDPHDLEITSWTAVEALSAFRRKSNEALLQTLVQTRGLVFDGTYEENAEKIEETFDSLVECHPNLSNFLAEMKRMSLRILKVGKRTLDLLPEWTSEASKEFAVKLSSLVGHAVPEGCPGIRTLGDIEVRKRIKKIISSVHFKNAGDEKIFCELVVIRHRYVPLRFHTLDSEFVEKGKMAIELSIDSCELQSERISFVHLK